MMTQSTCYKGTRTMTILGVLWHSTGANNPNLSRYVQPDDTASNKADLLSKIGKNQYGNDWNHITREAGLNAWIGKLADGTVSTVQTMPWNYRPWGCGSGGKGSCNSGWIQFEICEDGLSDKTYFNKVYTEACELTAYLCKLYGIDPTGSVTVNGIKIPTILCHADSYSLGFGSNHSDVNHWFPKFGKSMATARTDVKALMGTTSSTKVTTTAASTTSSIKVGDLVKITGSTYYTGTTIPSWVKAKNWYVYSISGDRAVINKSEDGKNAIMSAVKFSDLSIVSAASTSQTYRIHTVVKGDTLWDIAVKYLGKGSRYTEIKTLNALTSDVITAGQKLKIPN
jgi:LysM repeat protein